MTQTPPFQDPVAGQASPGLHSAGPEAFWSLCLAVADCRRAGRPRSEFAVSASGGVIDAPSPLPLGLERSLEEGSSWNSDSTREPVAGLYWDPVAGSRLWGQWEAEAQQLFNLYRPLLDLTKEQRFVIGHLGQSIDGRIATSTGDSCYINGPQNLTHMHRLRALCDVVLVGAATVVADDPQLTTRLVPGPHATRVVLDPSHRLTASSRVCHDGHAPTLLVRYPEHSREACGAADIIAAKRVAHGIDLAALLDDLGARGLNAIFVEGGGITVSRFLEQRLLDRLHIAIAPVIIGSGRHGLQLPEILALSDCLRPAYRQHSMGEDMLWDLDLQPGHG